MTEPIHYPDPPTRIVEPIVSPETAAPSVAVHCEECTLSGNAALAKSTAARKKTRDATPDTALDPTPESVAEDLA